MRECKHCKEQFDIQDKPKGWMANHSRWCTSNPKRKGYVDKLLENDNVSLMNKKKKETGITNGATKSKSEGREYISPLKGRKLGNRNFHHTPETKKLLSEKRKQFLKDNPDKHPWRTHDKFISVPCELFKTKLRSKGIKFEEEYRPLEERFFSIDVAFPDSKIGIEINGNQHYERTGELTKYYQDRHDMIVSDGWVIYEFHYLDVYDDVKVNDLINNIGGDRT